MSSPTPNKNFGLVVAALRHVGAAPPFDVVIAGARHEGVFAREAGAASSAIKHVGYVSDRELRALYEHAGAFVYPSLYEGFGLPPIEAMASGCPVIASSAASLPEVCGDAAVYVSPHDPIELAAAIVRVMSDEDERRRLATRGHARVQAYSWEAAARAHVDCIRDCLAESSSGPGAPGGRRWFRLPRPVFQLTAAMADSDRISPSSDQLIRRSIGQAAGVGIGGLLARREQLLPVADVLRAPPVVLAARASLTTRR